MAKKSTRRGKAGSSKASVRASINLSNKGTKKEKAAAARSAGAGAAG